MRNQHTTVSVVSVNNSNIEELILEARRLGSTRAITLLLEVRRLQGVTASAFSAAVVARDFTRAAIINAELKKSSAKDRSMRIEKNLREARRLMETAADQDWMDLIRPDRKH